MPQTHAALADAGPARGRRAATATGWVLAVVLTVLTGVVVGYGVLWFQLFGDSPDVDDYVVSVGGYGAAALVLALAVPALPASTAPRWLLPVDVVAAAVLAVLALTSAVEATRVEAAGLPGVPWGSLLDGVGGVLWAPWAWLLVMLGVVRGVAAVRRSRGGDR